jgi:hypothetical protein
LLLLHQRIALLDSGYESWPEEVAGPIKRGATADDCAAMRLRRSYEIFDDFELLTIGNRPHGRRRVKWVAEDAGLGKSLERLGQFACDVAVNVEPLDCRANLPASVKCASE